MMEGGGPDSRYDHVLGTHPGNWQHVHELTIMYYVTGVIRVLEPWGLSEWTS